MITKIKRKKLFHIVISIVIITFILFVLGLIVLRYHVEGETNMPFYLSKIMVISNSDGIDKKIPEFKWAYDVYQTNDIFLYIDKSQPNTPEEHTLTNVTINNIQIEAENKEKIRLYKPDSQVENQIFKNTDENKFETLEYLGDLESNLKQLKISNQGGLVAFRCSYDNLAQYNSNDETEIKYTELLKKAGIKLENLKTKITFDLTLKIEETEYKTTIVLDLPIGNVVEEGTTSTEIRDLKNFIFKRVNN